MAGLLLFVRDTGIGIPDEDLERVFEPFTQLDGSLARRFQGAGLGLYVSRALVAGHGGELHSAQHCRARGRQPRSACPAEPGCIDRRRTVVSGRWRPHSELTMSSGDFPS